MSIKSTGNEMATPDQIFEEAESRLEAYKNGKLKSISIEKVLEKYK